MPPSHTTLKGTAHYGDAGLSDVLEQSLYAWLTWGFVNIGAWATIERASSGVYGGDASRLRLADDPNYQTGQVWEGLRRDWVWETGVEYTPQPVRVSGVWVDNTFRSIAATGAYAHLVDYPNGRVVFSSPISPSSVVQATYTYRHVHVTTADAPWFRELQADSLRADDPHFLQFSSGEWSIPAPNRMQLPAVVIEADTDLDTRGLAIGGGTIVRQDVLLYVLAETAADKKRIHDRLVRQCFKRIASVDVNRALAATGYPLDADGSPVVSGLPYPSFISPQHFGGNEVRIENVRSASLLREGFGGLHGAVVRYSCETDLA